ncbi:HK97 gp10 family phage protein [uncultured Actinomyces sp.]|uniref:HK97 gp10 family phage protein n=1 Tax=uncultured Actinomyces sp. TaxID=249061 RepID=UPI0028ED973B|nr:HK97 gp10 family phage protein [uncultured Actinomyces sp.]
MARQILTSVPIRAAVQATAEQVRDQAVAYTPHSSGVLESSYEVEVTEDKAGTKTKRAVGRVVNTSPYALAVEFGHASRRGTPVPPARPLGRAVRSKRAVGGE